MNLVIITGRISREPEVRYNTSNKAFARLRVASDREYKNAEGKRDADFINCVAYDKNAEFIEKYLKLGMKIGIRGTMQNNDYEDDKGNKHYSYVVKVDHIEFLEKKEEAPDNNGIIGQTFDGKINEGEDLPNPFSGEDEELPFA